MFEQLKDLNEADTFELILDFKNLMHKSTLQKNHVLHSEGNICNHIYFIEKGIARAYYFKDGKDITAHFAVEQETITAIDSFIQRKKSRYNIELLEASEISSISYEDLHTLLAQKPQYEKFIRLFLETIYINLADRIEDLLFHSAKERYQKLFDTSPDLFQRVNLGHIASFIGVTQETLSRIRHQI